MLTLAPAFVEAELSDTQSLLERAQAGDAEAFCELCRIYETPLLRHAMTVCGNATLAEDVAQETLVEAWRGVSRYNGRCRLFTWLCAILLNRYRNVVRQKRPLPISSLLERNEFESSLEQLVDADSPPPDEAAQVRERAALVLQCVQALSPKYQRVIYLRFYVDDSLEGIAAALGCSVGTVKSRLFRALNKLRAMNALDPKFVPTERKIPSL